LGLDRVVMLRAAKVEKSYFDAAALEPATVQRLFTDGLEQGCDTVAPELLIRERFKPFVEDELPALAEKTPHKILCHPGGASMPRRKASERAIVAVGPEGGWVDFELELFKKLGFTVAGIGARPMRTEIAVPAILGALGLS
jgi:RsmE family RNA methyltransferase